MASGARILEQQLGRCRRDAAIVAELQSIVLYNTCEANIVIERADEARCNANHFLRKGRHTKHHVRSAVYTTCLPGRSMSAYDSGLSIEYATHVCNAVRPLLCKRIFMTPAEPAFTSCFPCSSLYVEPVIELDSSLPVSGDCLQTAPTVVLSLLSCSKFSILRRD